MTTYQKMKAKLSNYAPTGKPNTLKRVDYRYALCNGRHVAQFMVDSHTCSIEFVKGRRTVIDYTAQKAWSF